MNPVARFIRKYFKPLLILDFFLAKLTGAPEGYTLSGNAWRTEQAGKPWGRFWRPFIDWLFLKIFHQKAHCKQAHDKEYEAVLKGRPYGIKNLY